MGQILTKFFEEMFKDQFVKMLGADLPLQCPPKKLLKVPNGTTLVSSVSRGTIHCHSFQSLDRTILLKDLKRERLHINF